MELVWTVLAAGTSQDAESNNISLFNVLEEAQLVVAEDAGPRDQADEPAVPFLSELVTLWRRSDFEVPEVGQSRVRFECHGPAGAKRDVPTPNVVAVDLTEFLRVRHRGKLLAVPLATFAAGVHYTWIIVERLDGDDWTPVSRTPLRLVLSFAAPDRVPTNTTLHP